MSGEERERKMLEDQIARAKAETEAAAQNNPSANLEKRDGEKISLNLFGNSDTTSTNGAPASSTPSVPNAEAGPSKPTTSFSFGALPTASAPASSIPTNPLKRPAPVNVFKMAKTPKTDSDSGSVAPMKQKQLSEVERLMMEDQARKMNRPAGRGGYQGHGPRRG